MTPRPMLEIVDGRFLASGVGIAPDGNPRVLGREGDTSDAEEARVLDAWRRAWEEPPGLNPGIRRTVALLRAHGFETTDSGDGETHEHACDRNHGYVVIVTEPERLVAEADRLERVLLDAGVRIEPMGPELVHGVAHIQATYSPTDGVAAIDVSPIHDRMLGGAPCRSTDRP